ncbi:MAG: PepSY-like domain-containing protein [Bacteroidales bacterium]|jgi:hypothetical protein|nr:PepSY-like domain-containing protein [Bacteroidales bacterium]
MKKLNLLIVLSTVAILALFSSCESSKPVTFAQLPAKSQTFLTTHFGNDVANNITMIVKETDDLTVTWNVYGNGWTADFKRKGDWDDVDCMMSPVPNTVLALIPQTIINYCNTMFPNTFINEVNKEFFGYEIGLSNGLDIEFKNSGAIREIDD